MDRRGFPRDPEPRVASRQELQASTQDGPWKGRADTSPALAGDATGAESQDQLNAETGWLASVGADLRSFLGIAALMVFALPAVVLVLTLLGDDNKPVSMKTPTARGSVITKQDQPAGGDRSGNGKGGDRLPGRHDGSPGTSSEGDEAAPTRQTGRDQRGSNQVQDNSVAAVPATPASAAAVSPEPVSSVAASSSPTSTVAASSAPTSTVAASSSPAAGPVEGSGEAPTSSTLSAPPDASTGPAAQPTSSASAESAPPVAQQSSSLNPSASAIAGGMPASGAVPAEDFQGVVPDASSYEPSEYDGGSPR